MTKFYRYIALVLGILAIMQTAYGDNKAIADAYPTMYLRGAQTDNWAALEQYRFTREGNNYTIHLDRLSGEFKISNDTWTQNLGGANNIEITKSVTITGVPNGKNIKAVNLTDITISFKLEFDGSHVYNTPIAFTVNGIPAPEPEPEAPVNPSGTLPLLYINVYQYDSATDSFILNPEGEKILENEVIDKDLAHKNYFHGEYWLDVNGCQWLMDLGAESVGSKESPLPLEIKARGNFTRTAFAKKPFKLKLGKKQNLLNININGGKSKHWAILAHADDDKGYMSNFIGFALSERIGLPWTPRQQPIEVIINGDYRGVYFLTESIRVGDGRVPIAELDDVETDRTLISGGYIVELDNYDEDENSQIKMVEKGQSNQHKDVLRITFDSPEEYSPLQRRFIQDQFTAINDNIGENSDNMWKYLDIDDLARYYIVDEIISHTEAFHGSTYLHRDRGEGQKWHFSPLWDCGNAFNGKTNAYFYDCDPFGNTWIPSLRMNATFNKKVKETWRWFMGKQGGYDGLIDDINTYCSRIAEAAKSDAERWRGKPVPAGGQSVVDNSNMENRKSTVTKHLSAKINWLAQQIDFGPINGDYAEPERDTTPAQPLPYYAKEPDPANIFTVYFIDDTDKQWENVMAYIYGPSEDGIANNEALGKWPGTAMQPDATIDINGWKIEFEPEHRPAKDAKIIINCGSSADQTIDYPLINGEIYYRSGKHSHVEIIEGDSEDASARYYDITGRHIAEPQKGVIYIIRRSDNVSKQLVK